MSRMPCGMDDLVKSLDIMVIMGVVVMCGGVCVWGGVCVCVCVSRVSYGVDDLGKVPGYHGDYGCGGDVCVWVRCHVVWMTW